MNREELSEALARLVSTSAVGYAYQVRNEIMSAWDALEAINAERQKENAELALVNAHQEAWIDKLIKQVNKQRLDTHLDGEWTAGVDISGFNPSRPEPTPRLYLASFPKFGSTERPQTLAEMIDTSGLHLMDDDGVLWYADEVAGIVYLEGAIDLWTVLPPILETLRAQVEDTVTEEPKPPSAEETVANLDEMAAYHAQVNIYTAKLAMSEEHKRVRAANLTALHYGIKRLVTEATQGMGASRPWLKIGDYGVQVRKMGSVHTLHVEYKEVPLTSY